MQNRKAARLDRAVCCDDWRRCFPSASVIHLGHSHSDHCPLLVKMNGARSARLGEHPFKFQAAWLLHAEFSKVLESSWAWNGDLLCSTKCLAENLKARNRHTFGNIFMHKRKLERRLEGVVRALDVRPSIGLIKLESKLKKEFAETLMQEEM